MSEELTNQIAKVTANVWMSITKSIVSQLTGIRPHSAILVH